MVTGLPLGGMPISGPVWVPRVVNRPKTRSPSPARSPALTPCSVRLRTSSLCCCTASMDVVIGHLVPVANRYRSAGAGLLAPVCWPRLPRSAGAGRGAARSGDREQDGGDAEAGGRDKSAGGAGLVRQVPGAPLRVPPAGHPPRAPHLDLPPDRPVDPLGGDDRKSTRLNSSHEWISYAVFSLKKKTEARASSTSRRSARASSTSPRCSPSS